MSQIVIQRIRKGPEDSQRRFLAQVGTGAVPGADSIRALVVLICFGRKDVGRLHETYISLEFSAFVDRKDKYNIA